MAKIYIATIVVAAAMVLTTSANAQAYTLIHSYVNDAGNLTQESGVNTSSSITETHRFQGSFFVQQKITGSTVHAPWSSPFFALSISPHGYYQAYDLTVQYTAVGQQAWVKMVSATEAGQQMWRKNSDSSYHTRDRDWATPGTPYLVGPL